MSISAPPRPPAPARTAPDSKPLEREEIEALVEALIEEARRETRRRHRRYWAVAALVALVGAGVLILLERGAASHTTSPAPSARSGAAAGTPSSKIAFVNSVGRFRQPSWYELYVMNPDGSGKRRLARHLWVDHLGDYLAWSPDRRKLVFAAHLSRSARPCHSAGACKREIFVINADGSGLRRLTRNTVADWDPAWSPDGQKIAWTSGGHGAETDVFVMNADGSDQQNLTPKSGNQGREPRWSPDGRAILFTAVQPRQPPSASWFPFRDVYVMNADGSGQRNLTQTPEAGEGDPAWSPDGHYIAFSRLAGPPWAVRIIVMNADGSAKHAVAVTHKIGDAQIAGTTIGWSPDGRRIAFDDHDAIYVVNADGSGLRPLAQNAAFRDWSPDGRKLIFVRLRHPKQSRPWPPATAAAFAAAARQAAAQLWVMNANGSGQRNLTPGTPTGVGAATWAR
jgi:Tol biopolymer transport system component